METIKVRVTKSEPSYWYADKVGQVIEVLKKQETIRGLVGYRLSEDNICFITSDNCEIVEPTLNDRFEPLTSGGLEFHIYEEFDGFLVGRVKYEDGCWELIKWYFSGKYYSIGSNIYDLIPCKSQEVIALETRKAELQAELTEIENKLNEK